MANQIIKGSDLMVFTGTGAAAKSLAYATSCSIALNTETQSIASKDHGVWGGVRPLKNTWEMSSENLYTTEDFSTLFTAYSTGASVTVSFDITGDSPVAADSDGVVAPTTGWTPDGDNTYQGKAYITNINVNAPDGDNATYSVTFSGAGALSKVI